MRAYPQRAPNLKLRIWAFCSVKIAVETGVSGQRRKVCVPGVPPESVCPWVSWGFPGTGEWPGS